MKKMFLLAVCCLGLQCVEAMTPLWLRDVQISPNGREIAFCYKGDIYKVNVEGGNAVRLTTQDSYESFPVWSPDGKTIAFASDRTGSQDLFVMPAEGGAAQRITFHSATETPWTFSPDGKWVYFSAVIQDPAESALFPKASMTELYRVPAKGGRTEQVVATPTEYVCFDKGGKWMVYQDRKGGENEWRKHHTSSITRDIWKLDLTTGKHTNLTNRDGEDRQPVLGDDGKTLYLLSEPKGGTMNVYAMNLDSPGKLQAVTNFKTHPVRFLSEAAGTLCFTYDGEIYCKKGNEAAKKVKIDLVRDDAAQTAQITTRGGRSSVSPDGKQVAFVSRGEVFVTAVDYTTTKQITHTAAAEAAPVFSPDGRTLVYGSERDGHWQLYQATIAREEEKYFANATIIEEKLLLPKSNTEYAYPDFSPNGKELAFIQDRNKLMVMDMKTNKVRQVTDGTTCYSTGGGFDFNWSPDGKWFVISYTANKHDPYSDVGIVSAQGGPIKNLTGSAYFSEGGKFVMDGNAILFTTDRYGMRSHASWGSQQDVMLAFTNQDAYDKFRLSKEDYELLKELEKEQKDKAAKNDKDKDKDKDKNKKDIDQKENTDIVMELDGMEERIVRLTPNSSNLSDAIITKDGESLYYTCSFEKGADMWKLDLRTRETKLVNKGAGSGRLVMDKDGKNIFLLGGAMKKMDAKSGTLKPITADATFNLNLADEREYMFNHVCLQERKRFYNTNMHGIDWDKMTADYRKFLPHINNNYDFAEMLSEMLGELNVSHTGATYYPEPKHSYATANLGLLFDWSHTGDGLKVAEVVEKGPFDHKNSKLTVGCVIEKVDGEAIKAGSDFITLLNDKVRKKTLVSIRNAKGEQWDEVVLPISNAQMNTLLYNRWVKQRAEDVRRWSNGRLGYVHLQSMDDGSFRTIYSDILGKYNQCDGIVIDTRFNGGGRLHEDVEILFSGKKYLTQVVRGREACDMPSRRYNKPSIMITCEANYSNAHGTPWVYKHVGIGKVVGMPVPGTMTSVTWETLQDPSLVFGIPVIGYRTADGSYLENKQLEPDIKVANAPETVVKGEDTQLRTAVEELLKQLR
ncbi:MAG: S41 family peptidase [Bacteroidales bacterium]|nr:S41 family peptidase [Bacteroidales bacterium]